MKKINRRRFIGLSSITAVSIAFGKDLELNCTPSSSNKEIYQFNLGKFKMINFNDGYHDYSIANWFTGVPVNRVQKELSLPESQETVTSSYGCLYVETETHKVLIDTGCGTYFKTQGKLHDLLQTKNIDIRSIDTVIISHAHPDHIGGLVDAEGNSAFPEAKIYSPEIEWEFYLKKKGFEKFKEDNRGFYKKLGDFANVIYKIIKKQLVFVDPGDEIVPGIIVIDASGHTPRQLAIIVTSGDEKLINIADVVFHPLHLTYPKWLPAPTYMVIPEKFVESRDRIFNMAADENMLVSAMHFYPPPSLGRITKKDKVWDWHPVGI